MRKIPDRKVALVTGSARRIGAAIATTLHRAGYNIVLHHHHSVPEANALANTLNEARADSAIPLAFDLQQIDEIPLFVEKAHAQWGQLDCLVNNASHFAATPTHYDSAQWQEMMTTNLEAPYRLALTCADTMSAGSIINIIDIHSERPLSGYPLYSISKAGFAMATQVLAKILGPHIRVNGISPGPILWPEGDNALSPEVQAQLTDRLCLPFPNEGSPVAEAVLFLAEHSPFTTGQILAIDGGRSLHN